MAFDDGVERAGWWLGGQREDGLERQRQGLSLRSGAIEHLGGQVERGHAVPEGRREERHRSGPGTHVEDA